MTPATIAIHAPGDMGQAVGEVLAGHGLRVISALDQRSERTRALAAQAGIADVGGLTRLAGEADMVLSILVPANAEPAATSMAEAMRDAGRYPLFVDCNAISADSSRRVGAIITSAGGRFVDASIIGPPPRSPGVTRFYASGEYAHEFAELNNFGLDVRVLPGGIGQASGFKTCYASLTKGLTALGSQVLVAARAMGLEEQLGAEFRQSQPMLLAWLEKAVPGMTSKAHRFVGEMEEHAKGYAAQGLTPRMMEGAAEFYRMVATAPIGRETPEEAPTRTAAQVAAELAKVLGEG